MCTGSTALNMKLNFKTFSQTVVKSRKADFRANKTLQIKALYQVSARSYSTSEQPPEYSAVARQGDTGTCTYPPIFVLFSGGDDYFVFDERKLVVVVGVTIEQRSHSPWETWRRENCGNSVVRTNLKNIRILSSYRVLLLIYFDTNYIVPSKRSVCVKQNAYWRKPAKTLTGEKKT